MHVNGSQSHLLWHSVWDRLVQTSPRPTVLVRNNRYLVRRLACSVSRDRIHSHPHPLVMPPPQHPYLLLRTQPLRQTPSLPMPLLQQAPSLLRPPLKLRDGRRPPLQRQLLWAKALGRKRHRCLQDQNGRLAPHRKDLLKHHHLHRQNFRQELHPLRLHPQLHPRYHHPAHRQLHR